jgi:curved DNA-binding protein CbpA/Tfp pilus assembly protein PilF
MKTLYEVLGVRRDADPETVKRAFRKAVKAHHPDSSGGETAASERFHDIIAANEILGDPERRAIYDRQLALERELSQLAWRDTLTRSALAVLALALIVIGGSEIWIALTAKPTREERAAQTSAPVVTASPPVETMSARADDDPHSPAEAGGRSDQLPLSVAGGPAADKAAPGPATDSSVISDTFAALPASPPASPVQDRAIDRNPSDDVDWAVAELDEAIRVAPNDARAYRRRGNFWGRRGDTERALVDYAAAIRIDPNDIATFHDRGVMWQHNGELDKALADLDRAVRMSFADPEVYSDRGAVWFEKGRYDRALADFDRALKIDPRLVTAYVRRAAALDRKGDPERARADLEQASHLEGGIRPAERIDDGSDAVRDR